MYIKSVCKNVYVTIYQYPPVRIYVFSADLKKLQSIILINRRCTGSLFHTSGAEYVNVLFFKYFFPAGGVTSSLLSSDRRQRGGLYTDI